MKEIPMRWFMSDEQLRTDNAYEELVEFMAKTENEEEGMGRIIKLRQKKRR